MKLLKGIILVGALVACLFAIVWQVKAFGFNDVVSWIGLGDFAKLAQPNVMDTSNDEAAYLSSHQLIRRAGFDYENHLSLADDGYITQLIRIINPLADRTKLKWPPIMLQHGQTSNSKNFIMQSNKQHHPMKWPPTASASSPGKEELKKGNDDLLKQLFPSSNRSLAFMLANNGYDVWLTSTRGADENNQGYKGAKAIRAIERGRVGHKNMTLGETKLLLNRIKRHYWSFTLDDQIAQELPAQIATVLNATGSHKVTIFGFSNSALTTFAMLSIRPDISAYVDTFIASAPVVFYNRLTDGWFKWFMDEFMQLFPKNYDAELFLTDKYSDFMRRVTIKACTPLPVRYTICKFCVDLIFGESGQFNTNLELPFFAHLMRPTSWKCLAQHLQIVRSRKLEKFNYGPLLNRHYYGQWNPPEYDISRISPKVKIVLISGDKDFWANQATVDELRARLPTKPALDLVIENYNHLDLAAAFDVGDKVNLPLLKWLDERYAYLMKKKKPLKVNSEADDNEEELADEDEQEEEEDAEEEEEENEHDEGGNSNTIGRSNGLKQKTDWLDPFSVLNIEPPSIPFQI